jgi:hypothetical protein
MQALMRPPPGGTALQNARISLLHAFNTTFAAAPCAITADVESEMTTPIADTVLNIVNFPLRYRPKRLGAELVISIPRSILTFRAIPNWYRTS